jgi:hypothetical protein
MTDLHASIRSYLDHELTMVTTEDGYELRYGDSALATMGNPKLDAEVECVTRDGTWRFKRLRGGNTEAGLGSAIVARYKSNAFPGGVITLGEAVKLKLRPPIVSETWRVRRGARETILSIRAPAGPWEIRFTAAAREIYELPLLTLFAFHAMLVELDRPGGDGSGGGPYGGP